jgi:outer membrane biosynthesis protein TonB
MGVRIMWRVIAVLACGLSLAACSSWMPSFDMPSFGGHGGGGGAGSASLAVESDPPGAQASAGGASCVTPCRLAVAVTGPFNVNVALNGYLPQSIPVRVVQPDDPRLGSTEDINAGAVRLDPNPVYVELERAPPPAPPAAKKKPKRPVVSSRQPAPAPAPAAAQAPAPAPAPSAPTTAVAPSTAPAPVPVQQPMSTTSPWPMPR